MRISLNKAKLTWKIGFINYMLWLQIFAKPRMASSNLILLPSILNKNKTKVIYKGGKRKSH